MSKTDSYSNGQPETARGARGLAGRVRAALADCAYAQRRMMELRTSVDGQLVRPAPAPDTYAEFMLRTSGVLRHEPSARQRARAARRRPR